MRQPEEHVSLIIESYSLLVPPTLYPLFMEAVELDDWADLEANTVPQLEDERQWNSWLCAGMYPFLARCCLRECGVFKLSS
jgi:hypothetical protein